MHILIAAGGTGGHVYPALATVEALTAHHPQTSVIFVGSGGLERELVAQSGLPFTAYVDVLAGPVAGVSLPRKMMSAAKMGLGLLQSLALLIRQRPGAVLVTGGWSCLPVSVAAWLLRVPVLIFLPDLEPGASIRLLRRFAAQVAVTLPESQAYFQPGQTVVTGYPLRQAVLAADRATAQAHFGLDPARQTLLVFGGSRGARSINRALLAILPDLLATGVQVIHVTGNLDWPEVERQRADLTPAQQADYHAFAYLHEAMGLALATADLVVSRAGAGVLAEYPVFGLASVLVPYPHAWRYQKVNADYMTERGAAILMEDERMPSDLLPVLRDLLTDRERLAGMRTQAAGLARRDGAQQVAAALLRLAGDVE